jgi:hypothetical protein
VVHLTKVKKGGRRVEQGKSADACERKGSGDAEFSRKILRPEKISKKVLASQ